MKINTLVRNTVIILLVFYSACSTAEIKNNKKDVQEVYQLLYIEREAGLDEYEVTMLVSDRYLRIDETGEKSGFIIYDDKNKVIYSVSHQDKSVLVIKEHKFSEKNSPVKSSVEYLQLADAPTVSGNVIYNYRVFTGEGDNEETCTEIQLVENILPKVRKILRNYQKVISGQQVKMTDNKITDTQTACFYVDQIYNTAAYYEKGMPIQEWHSNERFKVLSTYKKITINKDKFTIPEKYRQFTIDKNSKSFIR
jgi:hypothetical protein